MDTALAQLIERVQAAVAARQGVRICGGGSKDFYGGALEGEPLSTAALNGVVDYEPSELVITARGGTPLAEIESLLAAHGQMLAFEPPHFGATATLGGAIAAGLSGPRRASAGALRDFVLGARLLDGQARVLGFGGRVMKNVAGYDVSRLLAGSLGVFGVIVEASLKVLPRPAAECTLVLACEQATAIADFNRWAAQPLPISATAWDDGRAWVRLSGAAVAIEAACRRLGGERLDVEVGAALWQSLREQTAPFFAGTGPLWRLSLPSTTPPLALPGRQLIEWHGAQRWLADCALPAAAVHAAAQAAGGHATLFRGGTRAAGVFAPLAPVSLRLHAGLKQVFDPAGVFCRGRLHPDF